MDTRAAFLRLRGLSDEELLLGLSGALGVSRRAVAEVVAHLGEVEERRLHLLGGQASLFAYCLSRLGMSEDEAWRRIEVARLVRCFPLLLEKLASGDVSLSVAALLKSRLTEANHVRLLAELSGTTVRQAREILARWFPQPDVLPLIRKLPTRESAAGAAAAALAGTRPSTLVDAAGLATDTVSTPVRAGPIEPASSAAPAGAPDAEPHPAPRASQPLAASRGTAARSIEPLSADRYKLQLTAGASLKQKLAQAQDLLRHTLPSGDLATIIERALDLLIEQATKRRFAATTRPNAKATMASGAIDSGSGSGSSSVGSAQSTSESPPAAHLPTGSLSSPAALSSPASQSPPAALSLSGSPAPASPPYVSQSRSSSPATLPSTPASISAARYIPSDVRRFVHARDGGRCTWQGPDGTRCECSAWLEYDHVIPLGRGGASDPANIRLLCKAHNRLAAELAYGRETIARSIERRRRAPSQPAADPSAQLRAVASRAADRL